MILCGHIVYHCRYMYLCSLIWAQCKILIFEFWKSYRDLLKPVREYIVGECNLHLFLSLKKTSVIYVDVKESVMFTFNTTMYFSGGIEIQSMIKFENQSHLKWVFCVLSKPMKMAKMCMWLWLWLNEFEKVNGTFLPTSFFLYFPLSWDGLLCYGGKLILVPWIKDSAIS